MSDRVKEIIQALGLGLSRIIRYAYPGFLLILLAAVVNAPRTAEIIKTVTPEVTMVLALVIGAGLYSTHRGFVIPVHHFFLCVAFYIYEKIRRVPPDRTQSPTRWLGEIVKVKYGRRILAYSTLRHGGFWDEEERRNLNVAHAESGLVVITAEGLLLAALYAKAFPAEVRVEPDVLFVLSGLFFLASYFSPWAQHTLECLYMKNNEDKVREKLRKAGLLDGELADN